VAFPADKQYYLLAGIHGCAAVATDGTVHGGQAFGPQTHASIHGMAVDVVDVSSGVCVLTQAGDVQCFGAEGAPFNSHLVPFQNPPYRRIAGGWITVCAQRVIDDVIECNDGQTFDFGPLRDLAAITSEQVGGTVGEYTPENSSASVCVITEQNQIRCAGTRFPPMLQTLPPPGWTPPGPGEYPDPYFE
jgi:hypothetical protein